jgi:L-amino acid N-acyltransferase
MMMATIRSAHFRDAGAIAGIWNPQIRETPFTLYHREYPVDTIAAMITQRQSAGHAWLVAEEDGRVAGFATFAPFREGDGYAHTMEHTIFLAPDTTGEGVGEQLMEALVHEGRAGGVHSLIACITGENSVGQKFHRDLGFETVGVIPQAGWKFARWIDLVIMQKML